MGGNQPTYNQAAFRARNDDGSETSATWKATENTDWSQLMDEVFRLRIAIEETAGAKDNNVDNQLQYSLNGGAYANVTDTTPVYYTTSANVADATATTDQIGGAGTFTAGEVSADALVTLDYVGGDHTEHEFILSIDSAQVADGDTFDFRVTAGGNALSSYSATPTATASNVFPQTASATLASTSSSANPVGATEVQTLSGTCTMSGSAVSGATVFVVDTTNDTVVTETISATDGSWSASVPTGNTYHVAAQYDDGTDKYNEYSNPFLVT